jgi:hypothetical protein
VVANPSASMLHPRCVEPRHSLGTVEIAWKFFWWEDSNLRMAKSCSAAGMGKPLKPVDNGAHDLVSNRLGVAGLLWANIRWAARKFG